MDPQSFIIGLMAGITLFGGGILIAMIVLERPRHGLLSCWPRLVAAASARLRIWLELKGPRRKITEEWLQAEADHKRLRETVLEELERRSLHEGPAKAALPAATRRATPKPRVQCDSSAAWHACAPLMCPINPRSARD